MPLQHQSEILHVFDHSLDINTHGKSLENKFSLHLYNGEKETSGGISGPPVTAVIPIAIHNAVRWRVAIFIHVGKIHAWRRDGGGACDFTGSRILLWLREPIREKWLFVRERNRRIQIHSKKAEERGGGGKLAEETASVLSPSSSRPIRWCQRQPTTLILCRCSSSSSPVQRRTRSPTSRRHLLGRERVWEASSVEERAASTGGGRATPAVGWAADGEELEVVHHQIHANEFRPSHSTPISSMLVISATSRSTLAISVPYRFMPVVNALRDGEGSLAQWGRERGAGERGRKRGAGGRGEGDGRWRRCDQWLRTKRWGAAAATAASYPRSSSPPLGPPPRRPSSSSDLRRRSSSSSAPSHHPPPQPLRRWPSPLRVEGRGWEKVNWEKKFLYLCGLYLRLRSTVKPMANIILGLGGIRSPVKLLAALLMP